MVVGRRWWGAGGEEEVVGRWGGGGAKDPASLFMLESHLSSISIFIKYIDCYFSSRFSVMRT